MAEREVAVYALRISPYPALAVLNGLAQVLSILPVLRELIGSRQSTLSSLAYLVVVPTFRCPTLHPEFEIFGWSTLSVNRNS